jgi:hypothetical protein
MNKKIRTISALSITAIIAGIFLFPTVVALAQEGYKPLVTLPGIFTAGEATNPVEIIKGIYGIAIGIGSVIATVMIIWAGFEYMYQESITGKSAARERITNAFLGLLVILGSYILLRTINPALVEFNLLLPGGRGANGVAGLIAVQKDFESAQKAIREAQEKVALMKLDVMDLNQQIASSTDATTTASLILIRDSKVAEVEYSKAIALAQNSIATVENYLTSEDTGTRMNIDKYYNGTISAFKMAREKLTAYYNKTKDPTTLKKIEDIDIGEFVFKAEITQLQRVQEYQNADGITGSYLKSSTSAGARVRSAVEITYSYLEQYGRSSEIKRLKEVTERRVKLVCSSCAK